MGKTGNASQSQESDRASSSSSHTSNNAQSAKTSKSSRENLKGSEHSSRFDDPLKTLEATLKEDFPTSEEINTAPSATETSDEIISAYNKAMEKYVEFVQESMSQRHKLQKQILDCIKRLLNVLIWSFNIIIGVIVVSSVWYCFRNSDKDLLIQLLDFLKYYVGAVVAELIGMLYFVTKSVFSPKDITGLGDLLKSRSNRSSKA